MLRSKQDIKVIDPVRHPNIQLPYELDARAKYKRMLGTMTKMLTVSLTHSMGVKSGKE